MITMKGKMHYFKDGTPHMGESHKMPNGEVHSGAVHGPLSAKLFHFDELSKKAKEKAMAYGKGKKKKGK